MIKFRCQRCGQKIAVNDEGVGAIIACPTCRESLIVPSETAEEFRPSPLPRPVPVAAEIVRDDPPLHRERVPVAEPRSEAAAALMRAGLLPHLARLMMDRLVQTLLLQRRNLMETQQNGILRVADLETRLEALQGKVERRLQTYERQISDLQHNLVAKEQENRDLAAANMRLARRAMELEKLRAAAEAESRDADLLLRA